MHAEARIDVLTGVANRRGFEEVFPRVMERARFDGRPVSIISLDIDHFKRINDTQGHEAGDAVLAAVGRALRERARVDDIVARVGGEEFVAVLPGVETAAAARVADRIRHAVPGVTLSAGVAYDLNGADTALYAAKRAGRDRTVVYSAQQPAVERDAVLGQLVGR